ncbi:hypothetical protein HanXRQr2_Chr16g0739771 [Helianthus annuus]|uniref:Uncharacterized protein n=2 Tax=Helianthus annuus TaxID=4232 RepID=A0A9K3DRW1_HELAN|nr:hypothetical protein HanXRQr2_Chr16g0739771 [Helianthus annuus]KAJ0437626.1 hypothetical protein HanHA300_Chr16g0604341 [Helianthus annuus]KAJ0459864.1 hypothetical protein HanHA89_Chr16g0653881 [Helianthus annuus]
MKVWGLGFIIEKMGTRNIDVKKLLNDRKFWFASFLIAWVAALQRQDSFKRKFGTLDDQDTDDRQRLNWNVII